jgi:Cu+-exporting ATPase
MTIATAQPEHSEASIEVSGMTCASCVSHVEQAAARLPGVESCRVNLAVGKARVRFDPRQTDLTRIARAITDSGYEATPAPAPGLTPAAGEAGRNSSQHAHAQAWFRRAAVGIILWLPVEATHWALHFAGIHPVWMDKVALITSTIALIYVGGGFYAGAFRAFRRRTTNMDTLIAIGATVAYGYSLVAWAGHAAGLWSAAPALYFMESTGLLALISLGHWLEARARDLAGSAIRQLMDLAPATALLLDDSGTPNAVPLAEVQVGDRFLVRPGDRVPLDGAVIDGISSVDESMISGEPIPVTRRPGDNVIGGTQNIDGRLTVRAACVGSESALARIVELVDSAQSAKPPVQQLADKIAAVFVPIVLRIALITAAAWYVWGRSHGWPAELIGATIANAACSVLIIACPCALGLALPAAVMVGVGRGARRGILIRDIDALQHAQRVGLVVLDKTGTVTRGKPVVDHVIPVAGIDEATVLSLAAGAEQFSEHPLARAIVESARQRKLPIPEPRTFQNEAGLGVRAQINGRSLLVGNTELLQKYGAFSPSPGTPAFGSEAQARRGEGRGEGLPASPQVGWAPPTTFPPTPVGDTHPSGSQPPAAPFSADSPSTHVYVAEIIDGSVKNLGHIKLCDPVRDDSLAAIADLHRLGLRTILVTGDAEAPARAVARQVGIDEVHARVRPSEKADAIRRFQAEIRPRLVAMVGDGINDAPALAAADLGIAIGSGSDIAREAGAIVLLGGGLLGVPAAIRLSRATMRVIRQNLFLAFFYNVLAIPIAALGLLNPLWAAAAMALSDLCVIGNALRLRRTRID